ncbi:flagellar filament capping protein FliD [Candidatus Sumerlaeota bacterium]|nr:flagellar filament capping protein FliD [Candidatus Sumerlaeota bacterium]
MRRSVWWLTAARPKKTRHRLDEIERLASFDSETETRGVLFADATVRSIQSTLTDIVSSAVVGLIDDNSLGAIGVDIHKKGHLSVDSDKLSEAFKDNFEVVRNIFALVGLSTSTGITFDKSTEATFAGTYEVSVTTAAERASVSSAQVIDAAGIAVDELLTFTMEDKTEAFSIAAGTKAADAATVLNTFFDDKGLNLTAVEDGGKLRIYSNGYGSAEQFSILSDQSGAVSSQLGFGTTTQDLIGVDVAGTIDGLVATGSGRFLTGADGSRVEGLKLLISSGGPVSGTVTFTKGIAHQMFTKIDAITDESDGIIKTKTESLKQRIELVGDQIQRLRDRLALQEKALRRQFVGLEVKLSSLKSGGDFLLSQLASINSLRFFG